LDSHAFVLAAQKSRQWLTDHHDCPARIFLEKESEAQVEFHKPIPGRWEKPHQHLPDWQFRRVSPLCPLFIEEGGDYPIRDRGLLEYYRENHQLRTDEVMRDHEICQFVTALKIETAMTVQFASNSSRGADAGGNTHKETRFWTW
jgi:hypothetical protein